MSIFKDKASRPTGFALGSIEGRVAIQYLNAMNPLVAVLLRIINNIFMMMIIIVCRTKDNFTFKCHRSVVTSAGQTQDIYAVSIVQYSGTIVLWLGTNWNSFVLCM